MLFVHVDVALAHTMQGSHITFVATVYAAIIGEPVDGGSVTTKRGGGGECVKSVTKDKRKEPEAHRWCKG